jgi:hypothetical protein
LQKFPLKNCQQVPAIRGKFSMKRDESPNEKRRKVTFYADPDVADWIDTLDSGLKSKEINALLREHGEQKSSIEVRLNMIETHLRKLDKDTQLDGFAIAALRMTLTTHYGEVSAKEFKKNYDDIYFGSQRPRRDY